VKKTKPCDRHVTQVTHSFTQLSGSAYTEIGDLSYGNKLGNNLNAELNCPGKDRSQVLF
jgi:hypothetical protein